MVTLQDQQPGLRHSDGAGYDLAQLSQAALELVGEQMGFYRELANLGSMTPDELARITRTSEQYVRDWLAAQAAAGQVLFSAKTGRFSLPLEKGRTIRNSR